MRDDLAALQVSQEWLDGYEDGVNRRPLDLNRPSDRYLDGYAEGDAAAAKNEERVVA